MGGVSGVSILTRSTILDPQKVIAKANAIGITKKHQLIQAYSNYTGKCGEHRAPIHAWEGKRLSLGGAKEIAKTLGLQSYIELEFSVPSSPWSELVNKYAENTKFSQLQFLSNSEKGMFSIKDYLPNPNTDDLEEVNINSRFYLTIEGKIGEHFMAVMLSENECYQLAPLNIAGFSNTLDKKSVSYPQTPLPFDEEKGLGWRRCVIVKSDYIPISPKGDTLSLSLTSEDLDSFARVISSQRGSVSVDSHEFYLVDGK